MNCPDFDTLMMFLDGELGEERMKEVYKHVESCSRCRNLIDSQRNLETSWRDSFVIPEDDKFRSMEWIIYRRMNRRARWKFFVPAAAGIIAVLLGVKLIMDNQPFKGRVTDLSRDRQTEYESYTLQFVEERDELPASGIDGFESEETTVDDSITASADRIDSIEDSSGETSSEEVGYSMAGADPVQQYAETEDAAEECFRGSTSVSQETDLHAVEGGEVIAGGSGGSESVGFGGLINEEECEESEIPEEIAFTGVADGSSVDGQPGDINDICTLSMGTDTSGSETVPLVASSTETCVDTGDNRGLDQSCDYYSRFYEISDQDMNTTKTDVYVELVFDAAGHPDSSTALLLDSLFEDWNDYIPFVYRDTVLVVPLTGVSDLFMDDSAVPTETIE